MSTIRSIVLVSSDPRSINLGASQVYEQLLNEIRRHRLDDEIAVHMASDLERPEIAPVIVVYLSLIHI